MTNDGQMDAAETGLDSEYKGTSTFRDGSIGKSYHRKAWRKLNSLHRKPSDDIYKSPLFDHLRYRSEPNCRAASATAMARGGDDWCSNVVSGVHAYCRYLLRIFLDTQCRLTPTAAAAESPPPHCMFSVSDPNGFQCAAFPSCYCVLWLLPPVFKRSIEELRVYVRGRWWLWHWQCKKRHSGSKALPQCSGPIWRRRR